MERYPYNFVLGMTYQNKHTGEIYLACECNWARPQNGPFLVLFSCVTGFRYNPYNMVRADWLEIEKR